MEITKIQQQVKNKKRYSIFIDEKYAFSVGEEVLVKYSLNKGMQLDKEFLDKVVVAEEENYALNYALNYLSRAPKTQKQIEKKMREKGYEERYIESTIKKLKEYRYIDDYDYALRYINDKKQFKKIGKNKLKQELYLKGIDKETIEATLEDTYDEDEEVERGIEIANKKLSSSKFKSMEDREKYQKLYAFLVSKGYNYDICNKIIKIIKENN